MRTYLGPWQTGDVGGELGWVPPADCLGAVDLRTLPEMAQAGGTPGVGCFVVNGKLPSEYTLLGQGDPAEVRVTGKHRAAWASVAGFAAEGDTLDRLLMDHLTRGSDPDGESAPRPLLPSRRGRGHWLELHLHRRVRSRPFKWGEDEADTERVRTMLRREFRRLMRDAGDRKLKDRHHHLRVLDFWCEQYGLDDWRDLVLADLRADVPGRLRHETTYNETWPTNSTTISSGQDNTWTETSGDLEVRGGRLGEVGENGFGEARLEADLSSTDHYAQAVVYDVAGGGALSEGRVLTRFDSAARNHYGYTRSNSNPRLIIFKRVAGTPTTITSLAGTDPSDGTVIKNDASGSTISAYDGGSLTLSTTDTAITGNLRGGAACRVNGEQDAFECGDLGAGGIRYTQLERRPSGIMRGTWVGW